MLQSLFTADSLCRVESQELAQEVQCLGISLREQLLEGNFRFDRQGSNIAVHRKTGQLTVIAVTPKQTVHTLGLEGFRLDAKCPPLVFPRDSGSG